MNARRPHFTALRAFRFPLAAFALMLGVGFALFAGCGLSTNGIPNPDGGGEACLSAATCNDGNACTTDTCTSSGVCENTSVPDGPAPGADQPQGTCQKIVCKDGAPSSVADDTNVPKAPDMCTTESCNDGKPEHMDAAPGTACTLMGAAGVCKDGACTVTCQNAGQCPSNNPCQTPSCDAQSGTCSYTNVSDGTPTPGVTQKDGDCHTHVCNMGADTDAVDDTDTPAVPTAMAGCATGICTAGTPVVQPDANDSACSTYMGTSSGHCSAAGVCSQCAIDSECSGTNDDCQQQKCVGNACTQVNTSTGTPTSGNPAQMPGDCLTIVCNGNGGTTTVTDTADVPSDPTGCNPGVCNGSTPGHNQDPDGTACGNGLKCLLGACSGCANNGDCIPPETCAGGGVPLVCGCTPLTCAGTSPPTTCGSIPDGCGNTLNCNDNKEDGNETDVDCGGGSSSKGVCATRCAQGNKCGTGSDCAGGNCVDGVCCNTACNMACEACTAAKQGPGGVDGVCGAAKVGNTDPRGMCANMASTSCGLDGKCAASATCAKWPSGTTCSNPVGCATAMLTTDTQCDGSGNCSQGSSTMACPNGLQCNPGMPACLTGCGTSDANCVSGYFCKSNVCTPLKAPGANCTGNDQCGSGVCGLAGTGNCCATNTCIGGACGFTGCSSTGGTCQYPGTGSTCATPSCSNATLTPNTCNGSGGCNTTPVACGGELQCNGTTACLGSCSTDANCVSGNYCSSGDSCVAQGGPGATCGGNDQCTGTNGCLTNCCASSCITGTCGATMCASGSGSCQYPGSSTSCGTPSCSGAMLMQGACNSLGSCTMMTGPCPNNFTCSSSSACFTACGTMAQLSADCVMGYYCDGVGLGACQAQGMMGAGCSNAYECVSNMCDGTNHCK
jgi:hypothetical protein